MIQQLQSKGRAMLACKGISTHVADKCRPTLVCKDVNANKALTMSKNTNTPETYYILTTCDTSASTTSDSSNSFSVIMKNQRNLSKSSTKYGFDKKHRKGYAQ